MYKQIKDFIESDGGTAKTMCLANVRKGFGISNKYNSAWEAWQGTQKHTGTPPAGVDVPVFFSYYATIDGVYKNWGHIGVRLANGKFWTDGRYFNSIAEYERTHSPNYVGWGESVNGTRVIQYVPSETWVRLSAKVSRWRVYKITSLPLKVNAIAALNPKKFGGLDYKVVEFRDGGHTAVIDTQDFGRVKLWLDKDASIYKK